MMTALEKMVQIEDSSAEKRAMRAGPRPSKPEGAAKRSVPEATTSSAPLRNQNQNQNSPDIASVSMRGKMGLSQEPLVIC